MPNRIAKKFQELKDQGRKALITFITAGYPDLRTTVNLVKELEKAGADMIELGIPFSDPLADGPTIQNSSYKALQGKVSIGKILAAVRTIRRGSPDVPLILMTYYNPVFHYNQDRFLKHSAQAGVDGIIVPDLPPEEAGDFIKAARKHNVATIFFLAPTTVPGRVKKIAAASSGFIYYLSLTGVTGARQQLPTDLARNIRRIKAVTDKPVCVGFGISKPAQVRALGKVADGIIVGSAIIKEIEKNAGRKDMARRVAGFAHRLKSCT